MNAKNRLGHLWSLDQDSLIVQHPNVERAQLDKFQATHWVMCIKCKEQVPYGEVCCGSGVIDPTSTGADFDWEC